jgi:preprotein translocase subunit SecG
MDLVVLIVHVLAAAGIIGLVLVQHGKGADVGAAFGTGSAGSVFGSAGSANFLSRMTAGLALVFFLTSIGLSFLSNKRSSGKGVMSNQPAATQSAPDKAPSASGIPEVPVAPAAKGDTAAKVEKTEKGDKTGKAEKADKAAPVDAASKAADVPKK